MDRKLISRRIGSILDDISRLSNALYAMDTTDIQRYPDNYETLSTDAALRAERIACRLRHLIYSSTTIRKGDYLKSASVMHGINITYENEVLAVTLPSLLPKRRQRQSAEFLLDPLYFALEQYAKENTLPHYRECVVCFAQVYDLSLIHICTRQFTPQTAPPGISSMQWTQWTRRPTWPRTARLPTMSPS